MREQTALNWFEYYYKKSKANKSFNCSTCKLKFSAGTYKFGKFMRCLNCAVKDAEGRKADSIKGCRLYLRLLTKMSKANKQKRLSENLVLGRI